MQCRSRYGVAAALIKSAGRLARAEDRAVPLTPQIEWRLALASHRDRNRSIAARDLLRIISEEVHELVASGSGRTRGMSNRAF